MPTVHHLRNSQSIRVVWLCEEMGLAYDLICHDRDPATGLAPEALARIHPAGTAPMIEDGDLILPESGAIFDYLLSRHGRGRLLPEPAAANYATHLFWFHWANASYMTALFGRGVLLRAGADPSSVAFLEDRITRSSAMIERHLSQYAYFGGTHFTAADIMMYFPLTAMRKFVALEDSLPATVASYLETISERPALKAAIEKTDGWIEHRR